MFMSPKGGNLGALLQGQGKPDLDFFWYPGCDFRVLVIIHLFPIFFSITRGVILITLAL